MISGSKVTVDEQLGSTVFINEMRPVQELTNCAKPRYLSRLIELRVSAGPRIQNP